MRRRTGLLLTIFLSACATGPRQVEFPTVGQLTTTIAVPGGEVTGVAWLQDGLVLGVGSDTAMDEALWIVSADGSYKRQLHLPTDPKCERTYFLHPREFSSDAITLVRTCQFRRPLVGKSAGFRVDRYDVSSETATALSAEQQDYNLGATIWDSGSNRGLSNVGSGVCDTLVWVWVDQRRVSGVDIALVDEGRSWNLADGLNGPCDSKGSAESPAWTADRKVIGFFASPTAVGVHGLARSLVPSNLYVMPVASHTPSALLRGVTSAGDLHWSPDGSRLAFSGVIENADGTWVIDRKAHLSLVTSSHAQWLTWSPDSESIAAVTSVQQSDGSHHATVQVLRLSTQVPSSQ